MPATKTTRPSPETVIKTIKKAARRKKPVTVAYKNRELATGIPRKPENPRRDGTILLTVETNGGLAHVPYRFDDARNYTIAAPENHDDEQATAPANLSVAL